MKTRRRKTAGDINEMRKVQAATEDAMQAVISYLKSSNNPNSEHAHKLIDEVLERHGCESPEGHIVSGGIKSADPHEKGKGPIAGDVPIVIDIFPRSKVTGYFADMSRTVCVGVPSAQLQRMYDTVLAAKELALSMIKPGVKCSDVQDAVDKFFLREGYKTSGKGKEFKFAEGFVHGLGHGVGLNIHEMPRITWGSKDVLEEGDVVTIEPGLYYRDIGGIRLEDMVLVTKGGSENLTDFPDRFEI